MFHQLWEIKSLQQFFGPCSTTDVYSFPFETALNIFSWNICWPVLPLTIVATKNSKLSQKNIGQNGLTKWSNIFSRLLKIILANMVRPFWPPQKLWDFTAVIMVWLNLPAKIQTEFFFTCQNSQTILAKNFLGDLKILQWPVWSDQSVHCKNSPKLTTRAQLLYRK